jgi:protein-tyrosine phosphatase
MVVPRRAPCNIDAVDLPPDVEAWRMARGRHGGIDEIPLGDGAGRLWLCGKHFVGPDPEMALASVGASTVVCLTERAELADRYPGYVDWLDANVPERALWHPIADLHAPDPTTASLLLSELDDRVRLGEGLLVHCGAGIGRAGTIAIGLLMLRGASLADASAIVAAYRPMAGPEAGAQAELLTALASFG